ncbi:MAG: T9SS C-terminal target domain-containing protein [Chryseobacterium sp.]|nr:MAG: T9SS C-terminal target domain-containing protein [Chryseobacterium sp.]
MRKFLLSAGLLFSGFIFSQITIGNDVSSAYAPIYPYQNNGYTQSFYSKAAIGASGTITGLVYEMKAGSAIANSDVVDVFVGMTDKVVAGNGSDWVPVAELTKVYSGKITLVNNKVTIEFTTPFVYDNAKNLVIAVDENKAGYDSSASRFLGTQAQNGAVIYKGSLTNGTNIDPSNPGVGTLNNILPNVTLLGLNLPTGAPVCSTVTTPADGAVNQIFLPKIVYSASAGATKYYVSVGTSPGGTDVVNRYDNGNQLDYYFVYELEPETTYYVTVTPANEHGEASACQSTSFTTGTPVANDNCSTAEVVTLPYNKNIDGAFASDSEGPASCNGEPKMNDGLWYEVTGTGGNLTIKVTPTSFWDPAIMVKEGTCDAAACLAFVNAASYQQAETVVISNSVPGKKYYVNVGAASIIDFTEGKFTLDISDDGTLSTNDLNKKSEILAVYPNPVKEILYINNAKSGNSYEIVDLSGRKIQSAKYNDGVNVTKLQRGIYLIKLGGQTLKFIKE